MVRQENKSIPGPHIFKNLFAGSKLLRLKTKNFIDTVKMLQQ